MDIFSICFHLSSEDILISHSSIQDDTPRCMGISQRYSSSHINLSENEILSHEVVAHQELLELAQWQLVHIFISKCTEIKKPSIHFVFSIFRHSIIASFLQDIKINLSEILSNSQVLVRVPINMCENSISVERQKKLDKNIFSRPMQLLTFRIWILGSIQLSKRELILISLSVYDSLRQHLVIISKLPTMSEMSEIPMMEVLRASLLHRKELHGWEKHSTTNSFLDIHMSVNSLAGGILMAQYMRRVMRIGTIILSGVSHHSSDDSSKMTTISEWNNIFSISIFDIWRKYWYMSLIVFF